MIAGLLAMAAANLAAALGALALGRRLRTGRPVLDAAVVLLLRLLLVSATVLAAGMLGRLDAPSLGLTGAAAAAGLWAWRKPELRRPALPPLGIVPVAVAAVVVLRLAAQVWLFSPYVGDSLSYHLPKVAAWVQAGAITLDLGPDRRAWFPAGFELVETWWTVFLHHDVLIELAGVEFLLLGATAAAALAEGLGCDVRGRAWAGLLFALAPGIHLGATSCLNDLPAAALVVTLFALVQARARPELALIAAALGVGIKPTVAFAVPGVLLLAWLVRREPRLPAGSAVAARAALGAAALVGAFWYLRNAVVHGNPIHPMGGAGFVTADGVVLQQTGPSLASLWRHWLILSNSRIFDRSAYDAQLSMISGWGVASFALGLPGCLALSREGGAFGRLALGFGAALASVFLLAQPDPWSLRFALFFPALLAVAAAALAARHPALRGLLAASAAVLLLGTSVPGEFQIDGLREAARTEWRRRWSASVPYDPWAHEGTAVVAGANRTYALYRPDFRGRVLHLEAATGEELARKMAEAGVRRLHGPQGHPAVEDALKRGLLAREPGHFFRRP